MTEGKSAASDGHRALHSPKISFEFFPPKTEEMERSLWETVNRLAPLTILATVAAFVMSICFRQMARHKERTQRWFLAVCLLIAAVTLFSSFRYVRRYREICDSMQQQMRISH